MATSFQVSNLNLNVLDEILQMDGKQALTEYKGLFGPAVYYLHN